MLNILLSKGLCTDYNDMQQYIINRFVKAGSMIGSALAVYQQYVSKRYIHQHSNIYQFQCFIDRCCTTSCWDLALKMLNNVRQKGLQPDNAAYNALTRMRFAMKGICLMQSVPVIISLMVQHTLLQSRIVLLLGIKSLEIMKEGIAADKVTYTTLNDDFSKDDNVFVYKTNEKRILHLWLQRTDSEPHSSPSYLTSWRTNNKREEQS
jgi:pentatricopeptide repeat protein